MILRFLTGIIGVGFTCSTPLAAQESDTLHFLVVGDWGRNGHYGQSEVAHLLDSLSLLYDAEFVVSTGDNFYDNGVASTADPLWNSSFENIYTGAGMLIEWHPVLGNHDYRGNAQAQIDYARISRRWNFPDRYYKVSLEDDGLPYADLLFIDTSPFIKKYRSRCQAYNDLCKQDTLQQIQWLRESLKTSTAPFVFVIGHHPVYSGGSHGSNPEMIHAFLPIFEEHQVAAYIAGHDHDLQHLKSETFFTQFFVSGAGSKLRPEGLIPETKFARGVHGVALVSVWQIGWMLTFIDVKGNELYQFKSSL